MEGDSESPAQGDVASHLLSGNCALTEATVRKYLGAEGPPTRQSRMGPRDANIWYHPGLARCDIAILNT